MEDIKVIALRESVFEDNNADAAKLRRELSDKGTFLVHSLKAEKRSVILWLIKSDQQRIKLFLFLEIPVRAKQALSAPFCPCSPRSSVLRLWRLTSIPPLTRRQ